MAGTVPSAPAGAPKLISQGPESITVRVVPPSDTGGPQVIRYEIEIIKMEGVTAAAPIKLEQNTDVTNMDVFTFDVAKGLAPGFEYIIRARAHNFITDYSILHWSSSLEGKWGATASFYSTNLPETVQKETFTYSGLTKTDVTIEWALLSSDNAKGYPIAEPKYTLQMDLCGQKTASGQQEFFTILETPATSSGTPVTSHPISKQAPGSTCRFKMFVTNVIGRSQDSEVLEVLFAVAPGQQSQAPDFVARSGGDELLDLPPYIAISWQPPVDSGGSEILGYLVEMKEKVDPATTWAAAGTIVYDGSAQPSVRNFTFQNAAIITAGRTY